MLEQVKRIVKSNKILYYPISKYRDIQFQKRVRVFHKVGYKMNEEIYEMFQRLGIDYFAAFGTLLGVVREKAFIAHDDDLDYIVNIQAMDEWLLIMNAMISMGYKVRCFFVDESRISEVGFEKNGIQVDFFTTTYDEGRLSVHTYYRDNKKEYHNNEVSTKRFVIDRIDGYHTDLIHNTHFIVPNNYSDILVVFYDENWEKPIKGQKHGSHVILDVNRICKKYVVSDHI